MLDERSVFTVTDYAKVGLCGALTTGTSHGFFGHPLDVIRMTYPRWHQNGSYRGARWLLSEGGLWYVTRGVWAPAAVGQGITGFSRFGLHELLRVDESKRRQQWFFVRIVVSLLVAAISEAVAVVLSYPFERLRITALAGKDKAVDAKVHPFQWKQKNARFTLDIRIKHYRKLFFDPNLGGHPAMQPQCFGVSLLLARVPAIAVQFTIGRECLTLLERRTQVDTFTVSNGSEMSAVRVRNMLVCGACGGFAEGLFFEGLFLPLMRSWHNKSTLRNHMNAISRTSLTHSVLFRGACASVQWITFDFLKWSMAP